MSCQTETVQLLRDRGHKATPQRFMILSALRHADGHLTAGDIFEKVRVDYPYVDVSTVYRTLGVLKQLGLVCETNMGRGETAYEWTESQGRHHHLICRDCDGVAPLDDRLLDELGAQIQADAGFKPDIDHFAIFGKCAGCQEKLPAVAASGR